MRAAIVAGSAPCAHVDFENARKLYPDAFVIAVNGACAMFEEIDAMLAGHTYGAAAFVKARLEAFPGRPLPAVWANWAGPVLRHKHKTPPAKELPMVTRWFDASHSSGATSAGKGILMALTAGYSPVVVAGCPLDNSGYSFDEARIKHDPSCKRVGDPRYDKHKTILRYREAFKKHSDAWRGKVFSMSGFTRDCLGPPPAAQL